MRRYSTIASELPDITIHIVTFARIIGIVSDQDAYGVIYSVTTKLYAASQCLRNTLKSLAPVRN